MIASRQTPIVEACVGTQALVLQGTDQHVSVREQKHPHDERTRPLEVPRAPQYRMLDHWRGLACLMIVLFHSTATYRRYTPPADLLVIRALQWVLNSLWLGVPIFFVISGYCIAATVDNIRRNPQPVRNYLLRRFRRIYPPYWISLAFIAVGFFAAEVFGLAMRVTSPAHAWFALRDMNWLHWIGNVTLSETWLASLLPAHEYRMLSRIAWSLCYEQQFYLLCLLLLAVCPNRFFAGATVLSAVVGVVYVAVGYLGGSDVLRGTFFDGRWFEFALGLCVYWRLNYGKGLGARLAEGAVLAALVGPGVLWLSRSGPIDPHFGNYSLEFFVCGGIALALIILRRLDDRFATFQVLRPLAYCGTICYSLYLVHWPFTKLVCSLFWAAGVRSLIGTLAITTSVAIVVSVLAGTAFFYLVERRYMNRRPVDSSRVSRLETDHIIGSAAIEVTTGKVPPNSRTRRWFQRMGAAFLGCIVACTAAEAVLRYFAPIDLRHDSSWYEAHVVYHFRHRPNLNRQFVWSKPYWVRTNSRGLREDDEIRYAGGNELRVLVFGDSFTFGNGVENDDCFVRVASRKLKELRPSRPLRLVNMGVSAHGPGLEYLYYTEEGRMYCPKVVVIAVFCGNDVADESRDQAFELTPDGLKAIRHEIPAGKGLTDTGIYQWLIRRSQLLVRVRQAYTAIFRRDWAERQRVVMTEQQAFQKTLSLAEAVWVHFAEAVQQDGAIPVFLLIPTQEQIDRFAGRPVAVESYPMAEPTREKLLRLCDEHGFAVVDLLPQLAQSCEDAGELYLPHDFHFNERGHYLAGEQLARALVDILRTDAELIASESTSAHD